MSEPIYVRVDANALAALLRGHRTLAPSVDAGATANDLGVVWDAAGRLVESAVPYHVVRRDRWMSQDFNAWKEAVERPGCKCPDGQCCIQGELCGGVRDIPSIAAKEPIATNSAHAAIIHAVLEADYGKCGHHDNPPDGSGPYKVCERLATALSDAAPTE